MRCNRIVGWVLVVAMLGMAFPGVAEAGARVDVDGVGAPSLLERIYIAVQGWLSGIAERFVAAEGASPGSGG